MVNPSKIPSRPTSRRRRILDLFCGLADDDSELNLVFLRLPPDSSPRVRSSSEALAQSAMDNDRVREFCPSGAERQWRAVIPAQGNALGQGFRQNRRGLKARPVWPDSSLDPKHIVRRIPPHTA